MRAVDNRLSVDNMEGMLSTDNRAELGDILTDIGDYLDDNPPALSLPPAAYTSSELWQLERERIFNRSWMLVAHVDQVAKTGDYVTVSVAGSRSWWCGTSTGSCTLFRRSAGTG